MASQSLPQFNDQDPALYQKLRELVRTLEIEQEDSEQKPPIIGAGITGDEPKVWSYEYPGDDDNEVLIQENHGFPVMSVLFYTNTGNGVTTFGMAGAGTLIAENGNKTKGKGSISILVYLGNGNRWVLSGDVEP